MQVCASILTAGNGEYRCYLFIFKVIFCRKSLLTEGSQKLDTSLPPLSARQLYRINTARISEMDLIMVCFSDFVIVVDYDATYWFVPLYFVRTATAN